MATRLTTKTVAQGEVVPFERDVLIAPSKKPRRCRRGFPFAEAARA
jgi:hypothetical protein